MKSKVRISLFVVLLMALCSFSIQAKQPKVIWTFENDREVRSFTQYDPPPAKIYSFALADNAAVGEHSLAIDYALAAGSLALLYTDFYPFSENWADYGGLSVWIYGTGNDLVLGHRLLTGVYEKMAELWIIVDWVGWREVHLDFSTANLIGEFNLAEITKFELFLSNISGQWPEERSVLYYDHVSVIPEVDPEKVILPPSWDD